jgi:acetyl esterase/lipase
MHVVRNIHYAPEHGERGKLDLFLPEGAWDCPIVMVIHGGGLKTLSKERMDGVSEFVVEQNWVAVSINYRLLPSHPFPAPLEDVLAAHRWILDTNREPVCRQDRTRISLLGASAGGFLAMAAGLILGRDKVQAIVSISGPSQRRRSQATPNGSADTRLFQSPVELVSPDAPPLLATHSRNDQLVKHEESVAIVRRMRAVGRPAALYLYDGPGELHGIWRNEQPPLRLFEHIEDAIAMFLRKTLQHNNLEEL